MGRLTAVGRITQPMAGPPPRARPPSRFGSTTTPTRPRTGPPCRVPPDASATEPPIARSQRGAGSSGPPAPRALGLSHVADEVGVIQGPRLRRSSSPQGRACTRHRRRRSRRVGSRRPLATAVHRRGAVVARPTRVRPHRVATKHSSPRLAPGGRSLDRHQGDVDRAHLRDMSRKNAMAQGPLNRAGNGRSRGRNVVRSDQWRLRGLPMSAMRSMPS